MEIENINIHSLPSLKIPERSELPEISAIYFVLSENNAVEYIGKADNLNKRWKSHSCCADLESPKNSKIAWIEINSKLDLAKIEREFLLYYKPPINKQLPVCEQNQQVLFQDRINMKLRREKLGLTQSALAEILEVKPNTVTRWENGVLPISKTVELAFENVECKLKNEKEKKD